MIKWYHHKFLLFFSLLCFFAGLGSQADAQPPSFTITSYSVSPSIAQPGQTVTLSATITATQTAVNYPVEFSVQPAGTYNYSNHVFYVTFQAGIPYTKQYQLTIPANAAAGDYTFVPAVYPPNWSSQLAVATAPFTVTLPTDSSGICGSANGQNFLNAPSANLCSMGTASAVTGNGLLWNWTCSGLDGGSNAVCTANLIVNGQTGSARLQEFATLTASSPNLCAAGTVANFQNTLTGWSWACNGLNGGTNDGDGIAYFITSSSGTSIPPSSQIVDAYHSLWTIKGGIVYRNSAPAGYTNQVTNLVYLNGTIYQENAWSNWYAWNGSGWNNVNDPLLVNGKVGSAEGQDFVTLSASSPNLCATGTVSNFTANQTGWTWSCVGSNGGTTDTSGMAYLVINGKVGSAEGQNFSTLSATSPNLCATGTVSNFTANQTGWTWSCVGSNGGTTDNTGTANLIVNGQVGSAEGQTFTTLSASSPNLCATGTVVNFTTTQTGWTWGCQGLNGGTTDNSGTATLQILTITLTSIGANPTSVAAGQLITFSATVTANQNITNYPLEFSSTPSGNKVLYVNAQAGVPSLQQYQYTVPTGTTAGVYTLTAAIYNPSWSVKYAQGTNTFTITNTINGQVGSASGQDFLTLSATSPNLCTAGTVINFTITGTGWTWGCQGSGGGTTDNSGVAYMTINGLVGSAKGQTFATLTATSPNLCVAGTVINFITTQTGWTWGCQGLYGGTTDNSGTANLQTTLSITLTAVSATPNTIQPGQIMTFSATVTASQNIANYPLEFSSTPSGNKVIYVTAQAGVATPEQYQFTVPTGTTPGAYSMTAAIYDPTWATRYAEVSTPFTISNVVNGKIGSAEGGTFLTLTATSPNLCSAGTVINFITTQSGWTWGCQGSNGGTTDNSGLAYFQVVNGQVGSAENQTFATLTATSPGLCATGTVINFTTTQNGWTWGCQGINGGTTDNSGYAILGTPPTNGLVGSAEGQYFASLTAQSPNLCSVGTVVNFTTVTGQGWTWGCQGLNGGTTDNSGIAYLSTGVPIQLPGPSAALFANPPYTCLRNFYVATNGSDTNSGTSTSAPWLTIQHADSTSRQAGDCINVAPGTYANGASIANGGNLAAPTGYVVYRCTTLDACKITESDHGFTTVQNNGVWPNYLMFDGFELAAAQEVGYGQGIYSWDGGNSNPANNGQGEMTLGSHHIWALNNIIHGYGQSGIQLNDGEYFYAIHNTLYDNSFVTCDARGSGISFEGAKAFPNYVPTVMDQTYAPFHDIVSYNVLHDNFIKSCGTQQNPYNTDGNGMTLDDFANQGGTDILYPNQTLVAFNIAYNNGGGGLNIARTSYATIANNTAYNNNLDPFDISTGRGEIEIQAATYDFVINNIALAVPATSINDPRCQGVNYAAGFDGTPGGCPLSWNVSYLGGSSFGINDANNALSNNINLGGTGPYGGINVPNDSGNTMWGNDTMTCNYTLSQTNPTGNQCNIDPHVANAAAYNFALLPTSTAIGFGLSQAYLPATPLDVGACASVFTTCP